MTGKLVLISVYWMEWTYAMFMTLNDLCNKPMPSYSALFPVQSGRENQSLVYGPESKNVEMISRMFGTVSGGSEKGLQSCSN